MISYLVGKPMIQGETLTLLVNGVGYKVAVGSKTMQKAIQTETLELHIYTHVRENAFDLYGFETFQELQIFTLVLGVSGVGPAIALSLANAGANHLIESVQNAQIAFFTAVPRVGKKLAQKIIIELKSKLGSLKELNLEPLSNQDQDIHDALVSLGFDENQVEQAIQDLSDTNQDLSLPEAVQRTIRYIGKGNKGA